MLETDESLYKKLSESGTRDELLNEFNKYHTLLITSSLLNSTLTLDQVLEMVLEQACQLTDSKTASIFLFNEKNNSLEFVATTDPSIQDLQSIKVPMDKGISGHVFRTGEIVNLENIQDDKRYYKEVDDILGRKTRAYLCVPLIVQNKTIGTAQIMDKENEGIYTTGDERLMLAFANQSAVAIERARLHEQELEKERLEKENLRMKTELEVAQKIQTMLLPHKNELDQCPDLDIFYRMDPASEVGGDFLEILPQADGSVYFAMGDVTDHGLLSGIITLMAQSSFRTLIENLDLTLTDMLIYINSVLFGNLQNRMHNDLNLTLMLLHYKNGTLKLAGQHECILILRSETSDIEIIDTSDLGIYIGLIESIEEYIAEKTIPLDPGDIMILFTDGATEAENENKEQYGLVRLIESLTRNRDKPIQDTLNALYEDIYSWIGSAQFYDDITMIAAKRK